MERVRVGLVGAGGVAERHARVLAGFDDVELAGVADPDLARARRLAERHAAPAFAGHEDLLARADLDAVYVCVPPFVHGPVEEAVAAAGLPAFVEKPLALDLDTAERIGTQLAESGRPTAVGHHWRYLDVVEQARELLAGRQVRLVIGHWLDKVPPLGWWVRRGQSGGQVLEQAVHVLDLARWLVGEVVEVHAVGDGLPPLAPGADIDSSTAAVLRFADGAIGTLTTTCRLDWKHRVGIEVYADGLALTVTEDGLRVHDGRDWWREGDIEAAKRAVDRCFIDAVSGVGGAGSEIRAPYPEALRTHRLACAVARSAAEQRTVTPGPEDEQT